MLGVREGPRYGVGWGSNNEDVVNETSGYGVAQHQQPVQPSSSAASIEATLQMSNASPTPTPINRIGTSSLWLRGS